MWTDLSIKDKSDLMRIFLNNGVSSLSDMRRIYDGLSDIESTQNLTVSKSKNEFEPQKPLREPLHNKDIIYTMGNWLNNRREQLYNNMMEMYNDGNLQFENRKIFGLPIFEEASPLYNNTKNNIVSSEINNQLLRAESAKYKEELLPLFTHGLYDTKKNEVILSDVLGKKPNYNKNVIKLHEFAHSSGQESPQEYVIAKHFNKEKYKNKDSYLFNPSEIYARLTTFRQMFNLDPTKKYSLDDIKELRKSINEKYKDPFNKEILDPIKKDIHKLKVEYIMKNIPDELRNSWWWKDDKSFEKTLLNDRSYTDTILNDFYKALPEDLLKKIDKLNKKGESLIKEKLGGKSEEEFKTKYFEGSDWINQFNDEDLMFLINDVAQNSGNLSLKNLAAFGGRIYDGEQDINNDSYYLGELKPAIVTPKPVPVRLTYYPISRAYKISHSELTARNTKSDIINNYENHSKILPLRISKKADDFDYNLITNNCSDETGNFLSECFNTDFTKGITTPKGLQRKVKEYLDNNNIYYTESSNKDGSINLDFDVPWYNYRLERDKQDERNLINKKRALRNINIPEDRKQSIINKSINYILERRHPDYIPKYRIYDGEQDLNDYQLSLDNYSKYRDNHTFTTEDLNIKPAPINYNEIALRQRYAESTFNNEAVSPKGAVGAYGIMPQTHKWYVDETGDNGDLKNPEYNKKIRDWLIEKNLKSDIHSPMDTDSVRVGKSLVQYNLGAGNTRKRLIELESRGIDTHNSFEWLDYFPKEPVDYVNFTLRNKDVNEHKSEKSYQKAKRKLKIK